MKKVCKEYIKEIKSMFPFKSRSERQYIKNLYYDIEEFCENEDVSSKQQLYEQYGNPIDVVAGYFSANGIDYVINKTRLNRFIRVLIAIIAALAIIVASTYICYLYNLHQMDLRQEIVISETIID